MEVVFLGLNDVGLDVYEWLCDRDSVTVSALVTTESQLALVKRLQPDIVVACGYQHIVPEEILTIPPAGCLNIHPGYLPHGRGFNPNVWSIVKDLPAGATVHYMDAGVDTGDIVARKRVDTAFDDIGKSLYSRIETACFDLFTEVWPAIEDGTVTVTEQDDDQATFHRKSEFKELCQIDPEGQYQAKELLDVLRALTFPPFDNAVMGVDGEQYYIEVEITAATDSDDERVGMLSSY